MTDGFTYHASPHSCAMQLPGVKRRLQELISAAEKEGQDGDAHTDDPPQPPVQTSDKVPTEASQAPHSSVPAAAETEAAAIPLQQPVRLPGRVGPAVPPQIQAFQTITKFAWDQVPYMIL